MSTSDVEQLFDRMIGKSNKNISPKIYEPKSFSTGPDQVDLIGNGSFAKVRRCYHDKLNTVVVKYFHLDGSQESIKKKLENVAKEAVTLVNINHHNIVKVHGITSWSTYCGIVMEEVTGGTLEDLLFSNEEDSMSWELRLKISAELADALKYLHSQNPPFVHCDLKPQNVLLTNDFTVKLADFGAVTIVLATNMTSSFQKSSNEQYTPLYCAPEFLKNVNSRKCASDMYSYAMIVYEIITRHRVFLSPGLKLDLITYQIKNNDLKPNMEFVDGAEKCLNVDGNDVLIFGLLKSLMMKCWETTPTERVTAASVFDTLDPVRNSRQRKIIQNFFSKQLDQQFDQHKLSVKQTRKPLVKCTFLSVEASMITNGIAEYLSLYLEVTYEIVSNSKNQASPKMITLKNTGYQYIPEGNEKDWSIYFNHSGVLDTKHLRQKYKQPSAVLNFDLSHVNGSLYKLTPTSSFVGLKPNETVEFYFNSWYISNRYALYPRWYVTAVDEQPQIIKSTDDDELGFVISFSAQEQEQQHDTLFTQSKKFTDCNCKDFSCAAHRVIPNVNKMDFSSGTTKQATSFVFSESMVFENEPVLSKQLIESAAANDSETSTQVCRVKFKRDVVPDVRHCNETYRINIYSNINLIDVTAPGPSGAFYATQTILALTDQTQDGCFELPSGVIKDAPRYDYRGLMIDTASNFIKVDDLLLIIKVMSMYKLNKLVLQLSSNDGWRIEIDGLPELTDVGAIRRHTENEDAVLPSLGSGPHGNTSGSGYYAINDYKKILKFASDHCIDVIPRICMPGQCNAAILSMKARFNRLKDIDMATAAEFLLNELNDLPNTNTLYKHHIMDPTMESTYRFIDHVINSLKMMHENIQPLTVFYIGGYGLFKDETWTKLDAFQSFKSKSLVPSNITSFHEYFLHRVTQLCWNKHGIKLGLHASAALQMSSKEPMDQSILNCDGVIIYANIAEQDQENLERGYKLANAGYEVVLSHASYLFFDHAHESDSEEIGTSWATEYIDDKKVFSFKPDSLYSNKNTNKRFLSNDENLLNFTQLQAPNNIKGVQAYLITDLLRNVTMIHHQLFPRLLAFAERAWHKAEWEDDEFWQSKQVKKKYWESFAERIGYKELVRLSKLGIEYRVSPPKSIFQSESKLFLGALYPGFDFMRREYKDDISTEWDSVCKSGGFLIDLDKGVEYEFISVDVKGRKSRIVKFASKSRMPEDFYSSGVTVCSFGGSSDNLKFGL